MNSSLSLIISMAEHVEIDVDPKALVTLERTSNTRVVYSVLFNESCSVSSLEPVLEQICSHLKCNISPVAMHKIGTKIVINESESFPTHIEYRMPERLTGSNILHRLSAILQSNAILNVSKIVISFTYFMRKAKKT